MGRPPKDQTKKSISDTLDEMGVGVKKEEKKSTDHVQGPLTPDEQAIFSRVMADSQKEWQTITEGDIQDFSLMEDPLKLPPAAAKLQEERKYAFRWIERTSKRLDQVRSYPVPKKWWICNSTNTPFFERDDFDPILGCICKLDQMLMFKPWWMHEAYKKLKREIADNLERMGDINKKDGIKQDGIEYYAGPDHKIGKNDEVVADIEQLDRELGQDDSGGEAFDDLVV